MPVDQETVTRLSHAVAHKYKRRCWWADLDDMIQEASIAIIKCAKTFDPQVGVPFDVYAWGSALKAVRRFLWKNSTSFSAGGAEGMTRVAGLRRVTLDPKMQDYTHTLPDEADWRRRVKERVFELSQSMKHGDLAFNALLEEQRPSVPEKKTYAATSRLRAKVSCDAELYELWRDRSGSV